MILLIVQGVTIGVSLVSSTLRRRWAAHELARE
jgi:hypothetical protein